MNTNALKSELTQLLAARKRLKRDGRSTRAFDAEIRDAKKELRTLALNGKEIHA